MVKQLKNQTKRILTLLMIFISWFSFACDCDNINPILEFYSSAYVFEGKIISKVYAKDSLTYRVTFDIAKHYKSGNNPKSLAFDIAAEEAYTGEWTSCDWSAKKNENWLVYAYIHKGNLTFSGMCSNSKIIDKTPFNLREQKMLSNAHSFKIEDYIFEFESGFNYCKNITNINAILEQGPKKEYKSQTTLLNILVDPNGNLKSVIRQRESVRQKDAVFNLTIAIKEGNRKTISAFEKDAIELIYQVKKWDVKKHEYTGVHVAYLTHIWVSYDAKSRKWHYNF